MLLDGEWLLECPSECAHVNHRLVSNLLGHCSFLSGTPAKLKLLGLQKISLEELAPIH